MPPVRWKTLYIIMLWFQIRSESSAENNLQDPITMTSDGWRPIVGSRRQPPHLETNHRTPTYKPSNEKAVEIEVIKSENPITFTSTIQPQREEESSTKPYNINGGPAQSQNQGSKVPPHSKYGSPKYQTLPPSAVTLGRPSQFGFRKHPLKPVKPAMHLIPASKRRPVRGQVGAHSTRNEVYIHPSGTINYPFIKQVPSTIRTRETQGLGLFGSANHFTVNQPNSHVEINRFPSINENVFEQYRSPGLSFIIPKLKNQQDQFSRNLVPPPPNRNLAEKEKLKNSKIPAKFKDNIATVSEPVLEIHDQFGAKTPQIQENLVHIPLNFDQNFVLQKQFKPPKPPSAIDVQVTKENLKVYHNFLPTRLKNTGTDYIDYDYHGIPSSVQFPKLQTYEVTEGKWVDNPNPYTFNYIKPQEQSQNIKQQPVGPPAPNPQITNEPVVELNLPPFLPTPFKPDPAYPTSPTQSEASTVFSQVSKKMNKFKTAVLANNPLFFDIKEVSTHYPILGKPEFILETESPTKDNEIVDEVTTPREELTTKKRRRRPQPRRPIPSTTTTTEEPQQTEIYESQKTQEDVTPEIEMAPKRQRQRPNRHRITSTSSTTTSDYQDSRIRYRTTTPTSEQEENSGEKRLRGRNRYRQRGNKDPTDYRNQEPSDYTNGDQTNYRHSLYRKRTRPTTTELPSNHKLMEKDQPESVENRFESKYFQNIQEVITRPQKIVEYEDSSLSLSEEDKSENNYETTGVNDNSENVGVKLQIGERDQLVTSIPDETTLNDIHNPENEIDSTTPTSKPESDQGDPTQSTSATTMPTTTLAETKTTTPRPSRIKSRPTLFKSSRPRFSVKDYRQRLTQYSTSTASTTTDIVKTTSEATRFRFPIRLRTRPTQSTTPSPTTQEDTTTEAILRRRFKPKDPRHSTETPNIIPETNVKSVNTRLRPFDRYKTSTESTPKSKPSNKSNFYLNRRRPSVITKTKLVDKENQTEVTTIQDVEPEVKITEDSDNDKDLEVTTVYQSNKITTTDVAPLTTFGISDDDYSQRISDLTSSFKSEYDTPGLFKSVAPISRRVPNYFTISTDDPILPIEAFFPDIKEKDKETE